MATAVKFTIETQTEDKSVVSVCHVCEKVISLELSSVARTMYRLNNSLFNRINSSTKILGGRIYREEIKESLEEFNGCGIKVFNKYRHKDVKIMDLSFKDSFLTKRQSIITRGNKRISFNPKNLVEGSGDPSRFDPQNLTFDNVNDSTMVCEIEEIKIFQDKGVKTFVLTDFMNDCPFIRSASYRIEIIATTQFEEYLIYIMNEIKESIIFLTSYLNSITKLNKFDPDTLEFKKSFSDPYLSGLGLSEDDTYFDLGSDRIKNSKFGKAAMNFYNGMLLLNENVDKKIYGKIMLGILPTSKTNPENIETILQSLNKLHASIQKEYGFSNKNSKPNFSTSKITYNKTSLDNFVSSRTDRIDIEGQVLGYNIFSEKQQGLVKFPPSKFKKRVSAERAKYYSNIDIEDETNFMTSQEKADFSSLRNSSSFLTPVNMVISGEKITTLRGLANIPIDKIREFRLAKCVKAFGIDITNNKNLLSSEVMSSFNIQIGKSKLGIFQRPTEEQAEPLINSEKYTGEDSPFTADESEQISLKSKKLEEENNKKIFGIISDVVPNTLLVQNGSIKSLQDLRLSNPDSRIRHLIAKQRINFDEIPPQIKSMMSKRYFTKTSGDILKDPKTRAVIDETQKNIYIIQAHTGFEVDPDGLIDLNKPIFQKMSDVSVAEGPFLVKAQSYEIPELGILKHTFEPTIYNNLLYIGV